jgi:hypothetical protein
MPVSGKPRRYLAFYGHNEGKLGGWDDYFRSFDNLAAAQKEIMKLQRDYPREVEWWHVVDIHTGTVVARHDDKPKI